ncbi:pilus assembly protein [Burkholderia sp. Ac-20379]|nr:pilus assembly protein [Burkholderia sp. Ac-20379]
MAGAALPGVLAILSAMLVVSAGGFEMSMSDARAVGAYASRSIAFHAAEAALDACERSLARRVAFAAQPMLASNLRGVAGEPDGWRQPGALDGPAALHPFPNWPGAAMPPACLIERWPLASHPRWQAYLLTAAGTGAKRATRVWLQAQVAFEGDAMVARRWRHVVAAPFDEEAS